MRTSIKAFSIWALLIILSSVYCYGQSVAICAPSSKYISRLERKNQSLALMKENKNGFDVSAWKKLSKKGLRKSTVNNKYKAKQISAESKKYHLKEELEKIPLSPKSVFGFLQKKITNKK